MNRIPILTRCFVGLLVLALTLWVLPMPVAAQSVTSCVFVREASHNIHGAFLTFYQANGGAARFGMPLTEAFMEDNKLVQYFTYARFEFVPQNPEPYRVQLGLLGMQYNITDPPIKSDAVPSLNDPNFRYFAETGLMIGFAIKDFYVANGGIDVFGYPVSQLRYENGLFVQYFQRARFEWNPLETGPHKVRLAPVGQLALDRRYGPDFSARQRTVNDWCTEGMGPFPPRRTTTARIAQPPPPGLQLDVRVRFPQTGTRGPQYVEVSVDDRATGAPVADVALYAIVQSPRGTRVFPLLTTDANGKSFLSYDIGLQPAGATTVVTVNAYLSTLFAKSSVTYTSQ